MRRRPLALVLTAALVGAVFTALPARAATEVPTTVQIEDPVNDANFLNDGDNSTPAGSQGDNVTPADAGSVSDFIKVWFSNTADSFSVHFLTQAVPPASTTVYLRLAANPGEGSDGADARGCLNFRTIIGGANGSTYLSDDFAEFEDTCNALDTLVDGETTIEELPDATGITTLTFPRNASPLLADGETVTGAYAISRVAAGTGRDNWASAAQTDNTKRGSDYLITSDDDTVEPPVVEEPEAPKTPKDPCKKLKGKKKKKCIKKNAAKPCAAYQPGELGAEAETSIITDAATEEAPVEVPLTMDPSAGLVSGDLPNGSPNPLISHAIQNVQVDTTAPNTGLYVRVEFAEGEDYDLYLDDAEGNDAAHAGGGNQAPEALGDGTGNGGHSESTAEQLDGVLTSDCGGYTVDVANALGMGEATLKFWLGGATWDPAAQEAIDSGSSKAFVF